MDPSDLVGTFLRGQNLEQVGRIDEAIELYEAALDGAFDSAGPYDRLIALYSHRGEHRAVVRVADAALAHVRTYAAKIGWYERVRAGALDALERVPRAAPREPT